MADVKLHRCRFTFLHSKALSACYRVQRALDDEGVDYEIARQPFLPRSRRTQLIAISGQELLPVIEFPDGSTYRAQSQDMAAAIRQGRLYEQASGEDPSSRPSR